MSATTKPKPLSVTAARKALKDLGSAIDSAISGINAAMLHVAVYFADADRIIAETPKALRDGWTFIDWAKSHADYSAPRISELTRAGRVAKVLLSGDSPLTIDGRTSESAVAALHKLLTDSTVESAEEREQNVRDLWSSCSKAGYATIATVKAALAAKYPHLAEAGSRGPKAGTEAAKGNGRKPKPKAAPKESPLETPTEVPDLAVSGPRLKAAETRIANLFAKAGSDDASAAMFRVASEVLETAERYGIAATRAAVAKREPKAPAKPKARTTRTKAPAKAPAKPKAPAKARTAK